MVKSSKKYEPIVELCKKFSARRGAPFVERFSPSNPAANAEMGLRELAMAFGHKGFEFKK